MQINPTNIEGVTVIEASSYEDNRGSFTRWFCPQILQSIWQNRQIAQINHSVNKNARTLRGLHFQYAPHQEAKLVRCIKGRVWDIAIDLRKGSNTFLQWYGQELTPQNKKMIMIPEGFAHGFQTLEDNSELLYIHSAFYDPSHESGLRFDDPSLGITWPFPAAHMSERDRKFALIEPSFIGL